jgi:hypothetical protein
MVFWKMKAAWRAVGEELGLQCSGLFTPKLTGTFEGREVRISTDRVGHSTKQRVHNLTVWLPDCVPKGLCVYDEAFGQDIEVGIPALDRLTIKCDEPAEAIHLLRDERLHAPLLAFVHQGARRSYVRKGRLFLSNYGFPDETTELVARLQPMLALAALFEAASSTTVQPQAHMPPPDMDDLYFVREKP